MSDTLYRLTNAPFEFEWNGKMYEVKKASLSKVVQFQAKSKELNAAQDPAGDLKLAAYSLWLILKEIAPEITENQILEETPGNIDIAELFMTLGFLNPTKVKTILQATKSQTIEDSSSVLATDSAGQPDKSAS